MMRNIILIIALLSLASCNFKAKGNRGGIRLTHDEAVETVQNEEKKAPEEVIVDEKAEEVNVQANDTVNLQSETSLDEDKAEKPASEAPKEEE